MASKTKINKAARDQMVKDTVEKAKAGKLLTPQEIGLLKQEIATAKQNEAAGIRDAKVPYFSAEEKESGNTRATAASKRVEMLEQLLVQNAELDRKTRARDGFIADCLQASTISDANVSRLESYIPALQAEKKECEIMSQDEKDLVRGKKAAAKYRQRARLLGEKIDAIRAKIAQTKAAAKVSPKAQAVPKTAPVAPAKAEPALAELFEAAMAEFQAQVKAVGGRFTPDGRWLIFPLSTRIQAILDSEKIRCTGPARLDDEADVPTVHVSEKNGGMVAIPIELGNSEKNAVFSPVLENWELYDLLDKLIDPTYDPATVTQVADAEIEIDSDTISTDADADAELDADNSSPRSVSTSPSPSVAAVAVVNDAIRTAADQLSAEQLRAERLKEKRRLKNQKRRQGGKGRGAARKGKQSVGSVSGTASGTNLE